MKDAARTAAAAVDGWLNETQGEALFDAAARCSGRGAIVEIGSWKGRSTIWLAHGARVAGQRVFAVDPHVNSREDPGARTLEDPGALSGETTGRVLPIGLAAALPVAGNRSQ